MTFTDLYQQYSRDVYRFALYLSGDPAQADDIAAETFARAWAARDRIEVGTVKAYLIAIARNLYRTGLGRRRTAAPLEEGAHVADLTPSPESAARAKDELRHVMAALRQLPEQDRAVLLMATIEGLPYDAIAASVGLSVAAVKVRVHRTRMKLHLARTSQGRTDQ